MNLKDLADIMFPDVKETVLDIEKRYPKRDLKEGVEVTRFAPSPTGFVHMGSLLSAFEDYKAAKDSQRAYTVYEKIDDGMKQD